MIGERAAMGKNVLIPITFVKQIIELLEYWDISKYDLSIRIEHDNILRSLHVKLRKLELRDAYAKIIAARDEDSRDDARIEYLKQKARLDHFIL